MVRVLQPANAPPDWKLLTVPEVVPIQGERSSFYTQCAKQGEKWSNQCHTKYMYKSDTIGKHPKDEEFIV